MRDYPILHFKDTNLSKGIALHAVLHFTVAMLHIKSLNLGFDQKL